VDDAKRDTLYTNINVFNYAECNRVRDAMFNGTNNNKRVINMVLPYITNLDYLSYSSYDSQNLSAADLYTTLNYMQSKLPTGKASMVPGERMWIGEYGWGGYSTEAQEPLNRAYIQRLLNWSYNGQSLPFILYWEMYSNFNPGGGTNFSLIDYQDKKTSSWYLQSYFMNEARLLVARFKETNGGLPDDTEFNALVSPLLNHPLTPPVALALAGNNATHVTNTVTTVSGTLTQGIYGDDEAGVWVFYGRQDGGTVPDAWENSRFVGVNTNFNPMDFSVTLSGLTPQTNYFYRFYARNAATNAWSPSSSRFSTEAFNASSFGSRLKICLSGYQRAETLGNFPELVIFSTNLPGFSYQQFASPSGSDLRFTDAGGQSVIADEIDEWNTGGASSVWVNVPSLSATNNIIWAYWGNPDATNPEACSASTGVWPSYDLVWHLEQMGFPFADSTLNYPVTAGVAPLSIATVVGQGGFFNGTTAFLDPGPVTNLGDSFTLSAWVDIATNAGGIQTIFANQTGGYGSPGFALFVDYYQTTNRALLLDTGDGAMGSELSTAAGAVTFGRWHLISAAIDRGDQAVALYVDGVSVPVVSGNPLVADFVNDADVNLGRFTNNVDYFTGGIDEVRIYSDIESSNRIWADYMTMASNSVLGKYSAVSEQTPNLTVEGGGASGHFLSWPGSGVGFKLFAATNLDPPVVWTPIAGDPMLTNNRWQISLPTDDNHVHFYRLKSL
jgi:hypothetical protein